MRQFLGRTKEERRAHIREIAYRRRYVVPNLVTLGNMFCGYLAIMYATSGRLSQSVIAITIAILLDGLDGRVARKLNATSPFGMEFDSFSDVVSFGVAPAVLMYHWAFKQTADEFGVFVTFVFCLCGASRLARFNITEPDLAGFTGMPIPGAAGAVLALIHFVGEAPPPQTPILVVTATLTMLALAILMVSNVQFFSIKVLKLQGMSLFGQLALGSSIALMWYNSRVGFFTLAFAYCLSGPIRAVFFPGSKTAKRPPSANS